MAAVTVRLPLPRPPRALPPNISCCHWPSTPPPYAAVLARPARLVGKPRRFNTEGPALALRMPPLTFRPMICDCSRDAFFLVPAPSNLSCAHVSSTLPAWRRCSRVKCPGTAALFLERIRRRCSRVMCPGTGSLFPEHIVLLAASGRTVRSSRILFGSNQLVSRIRESATGALLLCRLHGGLMVLSLW